MPIGKQLMKKLEKSTVGKRKHLEFQANFRRFQQNHREEEYQAIQRRMEAQLQKN
ncbi:hypothetical protein [Oceanobacillus luteolus]|uniref:YfhE family protein n=1 Tax=Oceanobacillus luteolus TaxID=1274358 RepID=A0ABW4HTK6_9BACI